MRFFIMSIALPVVALTMAFGAASIVTNADSMAAGKQAAPIVVAGIVFDNRN